MEYLGISRDDWEKKLKKAQEQNLSSVEFQRQESLNYNQYYYLFTNLLKDDKLRLRSPINKTGKVVKKKPVTHQIMRIEEPAPSSKPVFCLIAAFESKEAALSALGKL